MHYQIKYLILLGWVFFLTVTVQAQIFSDDTVKIQFAPTKVPDGVTWSSSVSLSESGLFLERLSPNTSAEVWVQSQPIAAGMSWRPPTSVTIKVDVEADAGSFAYLHAYFRYSCDRVHWSTWYNLSSAKAQGRNAVSVFGGWLSIPRMAQKAYHTQQQEWWKTNPAWSSDEHELCNWIVGKDPEFFSHEFPFIGYVQARIEGETKGIQLKSLAINISSAVSGLTALGKGRARSTTGEKWFFDTSKINK